MAAALELSSSHALRDAGNAHAEAGRFEEALAAFTAATAADAGDYKAFDAAAQVLLLLDGGDERPVARAVVAARRAAALAPAWAPASLTLGRCLLAARRWREAAAALEAALAAGFDAEGDFLAAAQDLAEARRLAAESETAPPGERALVVGGFPLVTVAAEDEAGCGRCDDGAMEARLDLAPGPLAARAGAGPCVAVWECGVVLAMALEWRAATGRGDVRGRSVVELGSGLGVAGLAAALLGADVVLTDEAAVVPRTAARVRLHAASVAAAGGSARAAALDWREPVPADLAGAADLVLAADCVYHADAVGPFARTLAATVRREALVCHKRRHEALDAALWHALRETFEVTELADDVHPLYDSPSISLWRLERRTAE